MPIKDWGLYPKNWKTVIRPGILKRADNKCEFCGIENYSIGYRDNTGQFHIIENSNAGDIEAEDAKEMGFKIIKIVLTIAHIDHNTANNDYNNLRALFQKCHINHDKEHHAKNSKATLRAKKNIYEMDFNKPVLSSKIIHINCNKELSNETINAINKAVEIAYNIK